MEEKFKNGFKKIKESQEKISREVRHQTASYILAALGFVVGLAWNDAVKTTIDYLFPLNKGSIWVKFIYAFIVTILIIVATIILTKKEAEQNSN